MNKNLLKIKVQVSGIKPSSFRTFLLGEDYSFWDLHLYIQNNFNLDGYHLWHFETHIGEIGDEGKNPKRVKLKQVFIEKGVKIGYDYDYGDNWHFNITCQGILENDGKIEFPKLLKSQGVNLIEDCGGVWGLEELIENYNNKTFDDDLFEDYEEFEDYMEPVFEKNEFYDHKLGK